MSAVIMMSECWSVVFIDEQHNHAVCASSFFSQTNMFYIVIRYETYEVRVRIMVFNATV
jgi:hypothetical protein